jgi:hypothetical protein
MSASKLACVFGLAAACSSFASAAAPIPGGLVRRLVEESRSDALAAPANRRLQGPPPPGGGGMGGGGGGGVGTSANECNQEDLPCACELLGDVGTTTASGTDPVTGFLDSGENVYGPFEAGFSVTQKNLLIALGCTEDNVEGAYVVGGIDTKTVLGMINKVCELSLPYTDDGEVYRDLLDECGGHTEEYHFHERLSCLYEATGGHSTQVAVGLDGKGLYGKYEDADEEELPQLDACGGHFGVTPDSDGERVYHYHVQDDPPFTFGCFGPSIDGEYV